MRLSDVEIAQYFKQGYVLLPRLFSPNALARLSERFVCYATDKLPLVPGMKIMRDIMVVKGVVEPESPLHAVNKMISFEDDPVLYGYPREPELLEAVQSLIGSDVYSLSTNVFNKPPGIDGRHPLLPICLVFHTSVIVKLFLIVTFAHIFLT